MGNPKHTPNDIHIQGDTAWMVLTNRARFPIAVTMIDAADVPIIRSWGLRWCASWHDHTQSYRVSARRPVAEGGNTVYLHRLLLGPLPGMDTDHINHNTLDNRRRNLRATTRQENAQNYRPGAYASLRGPRSEERKLRQPPGTPRPRPSNPFRYSIEYDRILNSWSVRLKVEGARFRCGRYPTKEEAQRVAEERLAERYSASRNVG